MEDDNRDEIEKFLGLEPTPKPALPATIEDVPSVNHAQTDYDFARGNMRGLIEKGTELFQEASKIAKSSTMPEHYTAAANMFKAAVDANERLLRLSKTHQEITGVGAPANPSKVTNQNLIISSGELLKLMKKMRNGTIDHSEE